MPASSAAPTGYQLNGLIERVTFFSEERAFANDCVVAQSAMPSLIASCLNTYPHAAQETT
jgi:hypothetical protein